MAPRRAQGSKTGVQQREGPRRSTGGDGPMAWEKQGERRYYYRSVRCEGRVKKLYYGTGPVGALAAAADAFRRAERAAAEEARRAREAQLQAAVALTQTLNEWCGLL